MTDEIDDLQSRLVDAFQSRPTLKVVLEKLDEHLTADDRLRVISDRGIQRMFEEAGHWPVGTMRALEEASSGIADHARFVALAIEILPEAAKNDVMSTIDKVTVLPMRGR